MRHSGQFSISVTLNTSSNTVICENFGLSILNLWNCEHCASSKIDNFIGNSDIKTNAAGELSSY